MMKKNTKKSPSYNKVYAKTCKTLRRLGGLFSLDEYDNSENLERIWPIVIQNGVHLIKDSGEETSKVLQFDGSEKERAFRARSLPSRFRM